MSSVHVVRPRFFLLFSEFSFHLIANTFRSFGQGSHFCGPINDSQWTADGAGLNEVVGLHGRAAARANDCARQAAVSSGTEAESGQVTVSFDGRFDGPLCFDGSECHPGDQCSTQDNL